MFFCIIFICEQMESQARIGIEDLNMSDSKGINLYFQDIKYSIKSEVHQEGCIIPCKKKYQIKELLKGISGTVKAGQVTAIMGTSGAGKTTLLNIIGCRIPISQGHVTPGKASGSLFANEKNYTFEQFATFGNYVMQNDVLLPTLTVRETLDYVSALKVPLPKQQRQIMVGNLIKQLKLERCQHTLVGDNLIKGISGGQKKRTSIAFEIISNPYILILDQPTSGLDSLTAYIICNYLKKLAKEKNKTILMTIHQPNSDIYELFDRLLLLVDGRCIYQGNAKKAVGYFDKMGLSCPQFSNPSDYFMSIMHPGIAENLRNYPKYFEGYQRQILPSIMSEIGQKSGEYAHRNGQNVGFCQKLRAILKKDTINIIRNPLAIKAKILQVLLTALLIGGAYFNIDQDDDYFQTFNGTQIAGPDFYTLAGMFFYLSMCILMLPLIQVAIVFPQERVVFLKEEGSRLYGTFTYFISKLIVEMPSLILLPLLLSLILYWMIGLANTGYQFFIFYVIAFLAGFIGNSLGLVVGSVISDASLVTVVIPLTMIPFILFSGFFKNRLDLAPWIGWFQYLSPFKYIFIAFMRNQFSESDNKDKIEKLLNFEEALTLQATIGIMIGLGLGFTVFSALFLHFGIVILVLIVKQLTIDFINYLTVFNQYWYA